MHICSINIIDIKDDNPHLFFKNFEVNNFCLARNSIQNTRFLGNTIDFFRCTSQQKKTTRQEEVMATNTNSSLLSSSFSLSDDNTTLQSLDPPPKARLLPFRLPRKRKIFNYGHRHSFFSFFLFLFVFLIFHNNINKEIKYVNYCINQNI